MKNDKFMSSTGESTEGNGSHAETTTKNIGGMPEGDASTSKPEQLVPLKYRDIIQ